METREEHSPITLTVEEIGKILQFMEATGTITAVVEVDEATITAVLEKTSIIT